MAPKNNKPEPILISSREGMQSLLSQCVGNKLEVARLNVEMEKEINAIRKNYQTKIDPKIRLIESQEAALQVWCLQNRSEFGDRKSIDLPTALIGFRDEPPGCEKKSKYTWAAVAQLLHSIELKDASGAVIFRGSDYTKQGDLSVDKEALLRDREKIPAEALRMAFIEIASDEIFYIKPKSEVLEDSKAVA